MICSSVNLDRLIVRLLQVTDSTQIWRKFRGSGHRGSAPLEVIVEQKLDEASLLRVFSDSVSGGGVPGRRHSDYGRNFIGKSCTRKFDQSFKSTFINGVEFPEITHVSRQSYINKLNDAMAWPFESFRVIRVAAEREVQSEHRNQGQPTLKPNGRGTTNLIRHFINVDTLPRDEVEVHLLNDLNEIYAGDASFSRISCREDGQDVWEIFLHEHEKGEIRLSQSGSSLQSVFIILSFLRLMPHLESIDWTDIIFAVEEPENNLHPALLRRLLNYLARMREEKGFVLVITTHSPVGIDWSIGKTESQIIHVQHKNGCSTATTSSEYLTNRAILDDLDIRASDMLQANAIVWVEGPSDRIYLRKWIDLYTGGAIKEGTHYTVMFYGGKLLSHLHGLPPGQEAEFISLLAINRNAAVVIDSDRKFPKGAKGAKRKPKMNINATKKRISDEIARTGGFVWITEGREIENYIPNAVFQRVVGSGSLNASVYDDIPSHPYLSSFKKNKITLAHAVSDALQIGDLANHLDLQRQLDTLCSKIRQWNQIA
ncbi:AAA family ATPase [Parvibaculum sp.]|uniref:AAA family ATPase n=2 Tax=Parvibaculum sp. TaxID=2024848 RepID=UPI00343C6A8A